MYQWKRKLIGRSLFVAVLLLSGWTLPSLAQDEEVEIEHDLGIPLPKISPEIPKLNLQAFRQGFCDGNIRGTSDRKVNLEGTTIPSLWWTKDLLVSKPQFNRKLVESWLVCAAGVQNANARVCAVSPMRPGRVEMLVNTQLWTLLDYVDRYEFLYRFGTATSECGYNIYVFNTDATLIADYTCDFQGEGPNYRCVLRPDLSGKDGLKRGPSSGFGATDYRIDGL